MRREKRVFLAAALVVMLLTAGGCAQKPDAPPQPEEPSAAPVEVPDPIPVLRAKPAPVPIPKPRPEPAPEPEEPADETLVTVTDYIPGIFVELKYATEDNFTGQVIYGFTDARLRYGTVKKLARVQAALLEQGYSLKIWDACRPVSAQFALWEVCPDPVYVANPNKGYSSHSRGNTVDVTLVLSDGTEIEMPTGFDDFSTLADRDYSDVPEPARSNSLLLEGAMSGQGFKCYSGEWWHFTDEDSYPVAE